MVIISKTNPFTSRFEMGPTLELLLKIFLPLSMIMVIPCFFLGSYSNHRFNKKMYSIWLKQPFDHTTRSCPSCNRPLFPLGDVVSEGVGPFIKKKFFIERLRCDCEWTVPVITKYNGISTRGNGREVRNV